MKQRNISNNSGGRLRFRTALWSAVATLLLAIAYFLPAYIDSQGQYQTGALIWSLRDSLLAPNRFWWQLGRYLAVLLLCHFLFFYLLTEVVSIRYPDKWRVPATVSLWLVGLLFLHTVNSGFFPHSKWAFQLAFGRPIYWGAAALLLILLLFGAGHAWWRGFRYWRKPWLIATIMIVMGIGIVAGFKSSRTQPEKSLATNKPNIILIGVDDLRPDRLAYMHAFEDSYKSPMRFLDDQLAHSVVFTQAYTSIARTYPSWTATLTGLDPLHSGVRFNLQDDYGWWRGKVRTLPQYLKEAGYKTLWAIDESTFANFGARQGFDQTVQPEPGAAFFLIKAFMADVPLVSILSNLPVGTRLFPMTTGNRALGFAYYPTTFSSRLNKVIEHADPDKPLFVAAHFELAHYPTIWADDNVPAWVGDVLNGGVTPQYEFYTLWRVDRQIESLMSTLKKSGRLENAIVVFLSDHGNGFKSGAMGKDRHANSVYVGDESSGHGTDVANLAQQHSVLAVRGFGHYKLEPRMRDDLVSLMDVTPTVLKRLGIQPREPVQGVPLDMSGRRPSRKRTVFFETGAQLAGLKEGEVRLEQELVHVVKLYRIRRNGRLVIRNDRLPEMMLWKDRAAFDGKKLLASFWVNDLQRYVAGAIDIETGRKFSVNRYSLEDPELAELAVQFCQYFSQDKYFVLPPFCPNKNLSIQETGKR